MDDVLQRIIAMCAFRNMKQQDLTVQLGLKGSSMTEWKAGRSKSYMKRLPEIADILGVTVDYLLAKETAPSTPENLISLPQTKKVPLIGEIACGEPILAIENVVDFVNVPLGANADMALTCKGDSMTGARIMDGDIVYIRAQEDVENGEIAAVLIGDEATLKRVYKFPGVGFVLSAENPAYDDMIFKEDDAKKVRIIGKAVAFTSFVR